MKFLMTLFFLAAITGCNRNSLFKRISSTHSGITFNNRIIENDSINPIDLEFLYNGGGIACGDFNNDSLIDLYFTASTGKNRLYLNKGELRFEDITDKAGVDGMGRWSNGALVADVNNDGWQDIYVCATVYRNAEKRKNLLYISEGIKSGIPVFREMAEEYGLADTGYSVQSAFFDYDDDGDLDVYVMETKLSSRNSSTFAGSSRRDSIEMDRDKLFRNDWNDSLKHPVFTEVSLQAGIEHKGYGLGLCVADLNNDGWKDIYVANDFFSNDHLYINNKNGTFTDQAKKSFRHTTQNAMGTDIADINNDGWADILTLDMNPEDNYRKKKNMKGNNYHLYQRMMNGPYLLQYVRNTLQLNGGPDPHDTLGLPVFSDAAYMAGVAETDWSWNALMTDIDNDGLRDILITNGYPRDVTDNDFIVFRANTQRLIDKFEIIKQMSQIKTRNYAFRNLGNLAFEKVAEKWGLDALSFSYGAVTVDLDNDGDNDYVINNINDEACLYENRLAHDSAFLKIHFRGPDKNRFGIGVRASIYYKGKQQTAENFPCRGYLSSAPPYLHFGLGNTALIDSVVIDWAASKRQVIRNVLPGVITVSEENVSEAVVARNEQPVFFTPSDNIRYLHHEQDFIDFDHQRLIPHKLSETGPCMSSGDLNADGLEDIVIAGNNSQPAVICLQKPGGFITREFIRSPADQSAITLFDADGDHDIDIYIAHGSNELPAGDALYQDRLFLNDGKANFTEAVSALPPLHFSKGCAKAADYDRDGDEDLFIGGRSVPGQYPEAVDSYILRNDSRNGVVKFTDVTNETPALRKIGMVTDAVWTDIDNDGWVDLIIAGDWMPLMVFKNSRGKLSDATPEELLRKKGLWRSLLAADFDKDGDIDLVAGNLGLNSYYRGDAKYPARIYYGNFFANRFAAIPTLYLPDSKGVKREYPAQTRDDLVDLMPALKKSFLTYNAFAEADIESVLGRENLSAAKKVEANYMASSYIENKGNGLFEIHALPSGAQLAPINSMLAFDIDNDGDPDITAVGNDWGTEPVVGRYDALNGIILINNGSGEFSEIPYRSSGFFVPGNAKSIVAVDVFNEPVFIVGQNRDSIRVFKLQKGRL